MSDEGLPRRSRVPFLLTLGEEVSTSGVAPYRYDRARQVGQVLVGTHWTDLTRVPDAAAMAATKVTLVARESTDDE